MFEYMAKMVRLNNTTVLTSERIKREGERYNKKGYPISDTLFNCFYNAVN